jgi:hypothetical protein
MVRTLTVGGHPPVLVTGAPHAAAFRDANGVERVDEMRLARNAHIVEIGGVLVRLGADLSGPALVRLAEGLRPIPWLGALLPERRLPKRSRGPHHWLRSRASVPAEAASPRCRRVTTSNRPAAAAWSPRSRACRPAPAYEPIIAAIRGTRTRRSLGMTVKPDAAVRQAVAERAGAARALGGHRPAAYRCGGAGGREPFEDLGGSGSADVRARVKPAPVGRLRAGAGASRRPRARRRPRTRAASRARSTSRPRARARSSG